jgi:hypothetical protein
MGYFFLGEAPSSVACYGIVSELFIPSLYSNTSDIYLWRPLVSSQFSTIYPSAPAYSIQKQIEEELSSIFSAVPSWTSTACNLSLRRYFCTMRMLQPVLTSLREPLEEVFNHLQNVSNSDVLQLKALWGNNVNVTAAGTISELLDVTFYVPSFPHRQVCDDYVQQCSSFLQRDDLTKLDSLFSSSPGYFPPLRPQSCDDLHISIRRSDGSLVGVADAFSDVNQTVLSLPWPSNFSDSTNIKAQQATWVNVTSSAFNLPPLATAVAQQITAGTFHTQCPYGFVVPDDLTHPRNHWISGTGCAEACR